MTKALGDKERSNSLQELELGTRKAGDHHRRRWDTLCRNAFDLQAPQESSGQRRSPWDARDRESDAIAKELVAGALAVRRSEALLLRSQATLLDYLKEQRRYRVLGFSSITALGEVVLEMRPRTTADRLALHRAVTRCPELERAFLDGRLSLCQALAVAPALDGEDAARWVRRAETLPVREIRRRVREARAMARGQPGTEASIDSTLPREGRMVSIAAPPQFRPVWNEMIDLARKMLGWEAPQYECLDAILAEAGFSGAGIEDGGPTAAEPATTRHRAHLPANGQVRAGEHARAGEHRHNVAARLPIHAPTSAIASARKTLRDLEDYLHRLADSIESDLPSDPFEAVARLRKIGRLQRPVRVYEARLLRDLRQTGSCDRLGLPQLGEFVQEHLGYCDRTARNRLAESKIFEQYPQIEAAYGAGEIGTAKVHWVQRLAPGRKVSELLRRAREVTVRQFEREGRLLETLRSADRSLAERFPGPLPQEGLEAAIRESLCRCHGWTRKRLNRGMRDRGIAPPVPGASQDPAENRALMDRLEFLVDLLLLSGWDRPVGDAVASRPAIWKTSACLGEDTDRIRFWAPNETAADLQAAIDSIAREFTRPVPAWVALTALFARVAAVWNSTDPRARPRGEKIFRRDRYRCQAPGCRRREQLEGHHIRFRSLGGTNDPSNLVTLCNQDHQQVLHKGRARLGGEAPHALRWELGPRRGYPPLLVLLGEKIVATAPLSDPLPTRIWRPTRAAVLV